MDAYDITQRLSDALDGAQRSAIEQVANEIAEEFELSVSKEAVEMIVDELRALTYNYSDMTQKLDDIESATQYLNDIVSAVYELRSQLQDAEVVTDQAISQIEV